MIPSPSEIIGLVLQAAVTETVPWNALSANRHTGLFSLVANCTYKATRFQSPRPGPCDHGIESPRFDPLCDELRLRSRSRKSSVSVVYLGWCKSHIPEGFINSVMFSVLRVCRCLEWLIICALRQLLSKQIRSRSLSPRLENRNAHCGWSILVVTPNRPNCC